MHWLILVTLNIPTKYETFNRSEDTHGRGPKNLKLGHVTQATPILGVNYSSADKEYL